MIPNLGKSPYGEILEKVKSSPNYIQGAFRNKEKPTPDLKMEHPLKIAYKYFTLEKDVLPHGKVPVSYTDLNVSYSETPSFLWLGHSSYFLFWKNYKILVDPVFSANASPVVSTNIAFEQTTIYDVHDVPPIDLLILTHDHFDHLDYYSIKNIHHRVQKIVCAYGMESHLIFWGIPKEKIHSLDWDKSIEINEEIEITSLTTRHNSGRTIHRNQTLWSAYSLRLGTKKIFIAGDGGFGSHFDEIGKKYGPFDFGTIENGQYNTSWPANHMFPEQAALASTHLGLKHTVPIHWGRFAISTHKWNDPIRRFTNAGDDLKLEYSVPLIGQRLMIEEPLKDYRWWDFK